MALVGSITPTLRLLRVEYRWLRTLFARDTETGTLYTINEQSFKMLPPKVASRYREYHFIDMRPYWESALEAWPDGVTIEPKSHSVETLAKKLREARIGKDKFGTSDTYKLSSPDLEQKWRELAHRIVLTVTPDSKLTMGPQNPKNYKAFEGVITTKNEIYIDWKGQPSVLENFCQSVSDRLFTPKPAFVVLGLTDAQVKDLEERYDMGFSPRVDGKSWDVIF